MTLVAIALGSNIDPEKHIREAATMLRTRFPGIRFSHVYRTAPEGYTDQSDFLNAAAVVESDESPEAIHDVLKEIELSLGKSVSFRFGPRTIDIDLILYGDTSIETASLTVPHPRAHTRRFVLEPLTELLPPDLRHPTLGKTWYELLSALPSQKVEQTNLKL